MNLAAADHVEELHKHEGSEDERVVAGRSFLTFVLAVQGLAIPFVEATRVHKAIWSVVLQIGVTFWDQVLSSEQEHEQDGALPKSLEQDVLDHFT